jgi:hypothetical protein
MIEVPQLKDQSMCLIPEAEESLPMSLAAQLG